MEMASTTTRARATWGPGSVRRYAARWLWSVIFFYATVLVGTILHSYCQHQSGAAERDEDATRRHAEAHADGGPDAVVPCLLVVYFFSFSAGCLLWAAAGVRWVHPVQSGPVQLAGAALLLTCTLLFVATHMSMGENWSPQPEVKVQHQKVVRASRAASSAGRGTRCMPSSCGPASARCSRP